MYRYNEYDKSAKGVIDAILKQSALSQAELSRIAGYKSPQSLNQKLVNNTISTKDFAHLLDTLGFELVILKK